MKKKANSNLGSRNVAELDPSTALILVGGECHCLSPGRGSQASKEFLESVEGGAVRSESLRETEVVVAGLELEGDGIVDVLLLALIVGLDAGVGAVVGHCSWFLCGMSV